MKKIITNKAKSLLAKFYQFLANITKLLNSRAQWHLLWLFNSKFGVGVSAVIFNSKGEILLLRHRFRKNDRLWGLPSGWLKKGETLEQAIVREILKETNYLVRITKLLDLRSGYKLRVEACFAGILINEETIKLDLFEILDAAFFPPGNIPDELFTTHRNWINMALQQHKQQV